MSQRTKNVTTPASRGPLHRVPGRPDEGDEEGPQQENHVEPVDLTSLDSCGSFSHYDLPCEMKSPAGLLTRKHPVGSRSSAAIPQGGLEDISDGPSCRPLQRGGADTGSNRSRRSHMPESRTSPRSRTFAAALTLGPLRRAPRLRPRFRRPEGEPAALKRVETKKVCMVNNAVFEKDQIPVQCPARPTTAAARCARSASPRTPPPARRPTPSPEAGGQGHGRDRRPAGRHGAVLREREDAGAVREEAEVALIGYDFRPMRSWIPVGCLLLLAGCGTGARTAPLETVPALKLPRIQPSPGGGSRGRGRLALRPAAEATAARPGSPGRAGGEARGGRAEADRADDVDARIWLGRRTAYLGRYREAIDSSPGR